MGRITALLSAALLMIVFSVECVCADVSISSERTSIINKLPAVTIYCDTDKEYNATMKNTEVRVNDSETDLESVSVFSDLKEGVTYFILIDISRSIEEADFALIKDSVREFTGKLSEKDKVYLISFGDMVYPAEEAYDPSSEELAAAINSLELKDDNTKLYEALGEVETIVAGEKKGSYPERNVAMIFSDGADDAAGSLSHDEAVREMVDAGIPLYAFAVGEDKEGKDSLGILARECNGALVEFDENNSKTALESFTDVINDTLVIKANIRNSSDIMDSFTVRVYLDGNELLVKENVKAHKNADTKDAFIVTAQKLVMQYWWIILIVAIAFIAFLVLMVIKRNKGVVNVDGKIVYGSKVQKKYHIQVKTYNTYELTIHASIDGGREIEEKIALIESLIVGRSSMCDIYFDDVNMSRQHFSIEAQDGGLYVKDLESTGGTYLNGIKVYSKQRINSGDIIAAGKTRMRINW
ncbi:MAG: VWA domain-containing protein [Anaerovoracaceae bacterium]|nr:VWA domain-containing protein [Anaerovoracaceae bacterium]